MASIETSFWKDEVLHNVESSRRHTKYRSGENNIENDVEPLKQAELNLSKKIDQFKLNLHNVSMKGDLNTAEIASNQQQLNKMLAKYLLKLGAEVQDVANIAIESQTAANETKEKYMNLLNMKREIGEKNHRIETIKLMQNLDHVVTRLSEMVPSHQTKFNDYSMMEAWAKQIKVVNANLATVADHFKQHSERDENLRDLSMIYRELGIVAEKAKIQLQNFIVETFQQYSNEAWLENAIHGVYKEDLSSLNNKISPNEKIFAAACRCLQELDRFDPEVENFVHHKSSSFLQAARDLVCSNAYHEAEESISEESKSPVYCNDAAIVSKVAFLFVTLLDDALTRDFKETADSTNSVLWKAICHSIVLFRSTIISSNTTLFKNVPRMAALWLNDTSYISDYLAKSILIYGPASEEDMDNMYKQIARLANSGSEIFDTTLRSEAQQTREILSEGSGLIGTEDLKRKEIVRVSLQQIVAAHQGLAKAWKGVLNGERLKECIGHCMDSAIVELLNSLMELGDLGSAETAVLHDLFTSQMNAERNTWLKYVDPSDKNDVSLAKSVPRWKFFEEITALLNLSLVGIVEKWQNGQWLALGASDVKFWIKRIFLDGPFREQNLKKIN